jgi:hypothetical protein
MAVGSVGRGGLSQPRVVLTGYPPLSLRREAAILVSVIFPLN